MKLTKIKLLSIFFLISQQCFCQFDSLIKQISSATSLNREFPREKIYVHYDKFTYHIGDTLWMKGYIVSAIDNAAADSSKIAYLEIFNSSGNLIKRVSTYCAAGIFYSQIKLSEGDFRQGAYLLRAYTNYMRNYGDSLFFESHFEISAPISDAKDIIVRKLRVTEKRFILNVIPQKAATEEQQELKVILKNNQGIVFTQYKHIDKNGACIIDTLLNEIKDGDRLQVELYEKDQLKAMLPVQADTDKNIDLSFFPEGGSFIANKMQLLAFKAVNIYGEGVEVKGFIENDQQQVITKFSSIHRGMGMMWLKPAIDEHYTAVLDNGLRFQLPSAKISGTQLQISNQPGTDSVVVMIDASHDLYNKDFYFLATAKGISCAAGVIHLKNDPYRLSFSKKIFPSGIARFTLYDNSMLPVNERIILVWHNDALRLNTGTNKNFYYGRDSVLISLKATDQNNKPVTGSFSVAVIDTGLISYPRYKENIISYLLLSSDIRGKIEDPGYYFQHPLAEATEALMLTQGWVEYNHSFATGLFSYEQGFRVKGIVRDLFQKGVPDATITVLGKDGRHNTFIADTRTDKKGRFILDSFPAFVSDSVSMIITARNKKGRSFGMGIDIEKPLYPVYHHIMNPHPIKQNAYYDTLLTVQPSGYSYIQAKKEKGYLPDVIITGKTRVKGSKNLNADGGADQIITEKTLGKTPKENLLDILGKQVPGFHKGNLGRGPLQVYKRNGDMIVFIIDGYNINQYYDPVSESNTAFIEYTERFLKYISGEDIAGIEIMHTARNSFAYEMSFNIHSNGLINYTFIEITTYSGNGAFSKKMPGVYLYAPLVPVISKKFYSPDYSEEPDVIPDYRTTVYWKPDIITNEKGEATISFFTSDSKSGYLVIIQGTDLNGGLGVAYLPLARKPLSK